MGRNKIIAAKSAMDLYLLNNKNFVLRRSYLVSGRNTHTLPQGSPYGSAVFKLITRLKRGFHTSNTLKIVSLLALVGAENSVSGDKTDGGADTGRCVVESLRLEPSLTHT